LRGASRTLRCVCVLQLLISGDTVVEIDLKAPRHSSCPPLGTVPCPRTQACSTHYRLMIHKAHCAWSHARTRTLWPTPHAPSERRSRALCARASHRIGTRCHGVAPLWGLQARHCSPYEGSRRSCRWGSDRCMLSSKDEGRLPSASTCTNGTQAAAVHKGLPCSERSLSTEDDDSLASCQCTGKFRLNLMMPVLAGSI